MKISSVDWSSAKGDEKTIGISIGPKKKKSLIPGLNAIDHKKLIFS